MTLARHEVFLALTQPVSTTVRAPPRWPRATMARHSLADPLVEFRPAMGFTRSIFACTAARGRRSR
jgi:hypothetical protein